MGTDSLVKLLELLQCHASHPTFSGDNRLARVELPRPLVPVCGPGEDMSIVLPIHKLVLSTILSLAASAGRDIENEGTLSP